MIKNNGYAGKYIGGYHISLELASSSSNRVFLGESVSPDRHNAAIKRIYTVTITAREDEENFLREISTLKELKHPYILPLLSAYILRGTPYIITEYAPNGTLRDRLQRQAPEPIAQAEAITILSQVGQALQYAHQRNKIHGNLKPQNIFFNKKGDALLADFKFTSLSSLHDPSICPSSPGFAYMSAEQIEGINSKENDQYSLGCIAYEMFTGRKPFTTPSIEQPGTYYKTRALIAPTKLNPALPAHIEQAILKAMAKEPSRRYRNILEFTNALGNPNILIVPNKPLLRTVVNASRSTSQQKPWGSPPFPGLKIATAGATTLAQFTAKAALLRNTLTSLTGFSAPIMPKGKLVGPLFTPTKRKGLQPFLIIASILLIIVLIVGTAFIFTSSHLHQSNQTATRTGATPPTVPHGTPIHGKIKTGAPQPHPKRTAGGITVASQPTQPAQHNQHNTTTPPAPKPTPAHTPPPTHPTATATTIPPTTVLAVAPTILNGNNCANGNGSFTCTVTLSLGAAAGTSQKWYTYSVGVGANFNPSKGTIAPGQAINIQITVFDTCTKTGTFVFVSSKTNVTATWNCA